MISRTKKYVKEYNKNYRMKHKKEISMQRKKYREINRTKLIEYSRMYNPQWILENKERKKLMNKEYYKKNSLIAKKRAKEWYVSNKDKRNSYVLNRLKNDKNFRIACRLRSRVRKTCLLFLKNNKILAKKYGLNYNAIIEHLKPFPQDLSKYHIDHIKPLCSFDLTDPEQIKQAFSPENHQWLLAEENLKKGRKYG